MLALGDSILVGLRYFRDVQGRARVGTVSNRALQFAFAEEGNSHVSYSEQ
jgi:hypothetical protein